MGSCASVYGLYACVCLGVTVYMCVIVCMCAHMYIVWVRFACMCVPG